MKCDKCGENEATVFYRANINGQESRRCLCADCAREEGLGVITRPSLDFFAPFEDFFAPMLSPFDGFGGAARRMMAPSSAFPRVRYVSEAPVPEARPQEESETKIPSDAGADIRARRERAALKAQLASAVAAEDYESAARLRDQLRAMGE